MTKQNTKWFLFITTLQSDIIQSIFVTAYPIKIVMIVLCQSRYFCTSYVMHDPIENETHTDKLVVR